MANMLLGAGAIEPLDIVQINPNSGLALRQPNIYKTVIWSATGLQTLWTATAGKRWRLLRLCVGFTADSALAVAARLSFTLIDNGGAGTFLQNLYPVFIPGAAGAAFVDDSYSPWLDLGDGQVAVNTGATMQIQFSGIAGLTGGAAFAIAAGVEE